MGKIINSPNGTKNYVFRKKRAFPANEWGKSSINSPDGKNCVPKKVSISCPTCDTRHDSRN